MKKYAAGLIFILVLFACTPPATPIPTTSPEITAVPTPTGTPPPPAIIIHREVDCLTTSQEAGELVVTFHSGDIVPLVGKDDYGEYWVVIDPASDTGCWIPREDTSSQGIVDYLPNLVPPPTSMPHSPDAPGSLQASLEGCGRSNKDWIPIVILNWEDLSDNEDSFLLFRNGQLIESAGQDEIQYRDVLPVQISPDVNVNYAIRAFSRTTGESEQVEIDVHFLCK